MWMMMGAAAALNSASCDMIDARGTLIEAVSSVCERAPEELEILFFFLFSGE